jgi:hypothetical protein
LLRAGLEAEVTGQAFALTLPEVTLYPFPQIRARVAGLQDHFKIGVDEAVNLNVLSSGDDLTIVILLF